MLSRKRFSFYLNNLLRSLFFVVMGIGFLVGINISLWGAGEKEAPPVIEREDVLSLTAPEAAERDMPDHGFTGKSEDAVLDIETAVELALTNNLNLITQQLEIKTKERAMDHYWNQFVPRVGASIGLNRMNESPQIPPMSPWAVSAGIDASLNLNIALFQGIQNLRQEYQAGLLSYEDAKRKLELEVRKNFYNLLLLQENHELTLRNVEAARRRAEQAEINYRNGLVPELALLRAQVAYENLRPVLEEMTTAYAGAVSGFRYSLGLPRGTGLNLKGEIKAPETIEFDTESLIQRYVTDRLDIRSLVHSLNILETGLTGRKMQTYTPNLSLGFSYNPTLQDPWENSWFEGDNWADRGAFRITLSMQLDGMLPFSQTQQAIQDMEDQKSKLRIGLAQAVTGAELEIQNLVMRLNRARSAIKTRTLNVELAKRAYEMAEEAYQAGNKELLEVQDAENELRTAEVEVLKETYNYLVGLLDLEYALNTRIDEIKDGTK